MEMACLFIFLNLFTSYIEQINGKFLWKMKAKPQENHFPKPQSELHAGKELNSPYNAQTYLTTSSLDMELS